MKTLLLAVVLLFTVTEISAQVQIDTICMPSARVARIADTIAYLRKFEQYALTSGDALSKCEEVIEAERKQMQGYMAQRNASVKANEILAAQLALEKTISEQWRKSASDMDIRMQKAKRRSRTWGALFGASAGAGLIAGLLLALL